MYKCRGSRKILLNVEKCGNVASHNIYKTLETVICTNKTLKKTHVKHQRSET